MLRVVPRKAWALTKSSLKPHAYRMNHAEARISINAPAERERRELCAWAAAVKTVGFVFSFSRTVTMGAQKEGSGRTAKTAVSYGKPSIIILFGFVSL